MGDGPAGRDPRLKLLAVLLWAACPRRRAPGAFALRAGPGRLVLLASGGRPPERALLRAYLGFLLGWMACQLALGLWQETGWELAVRRAGLLGLRLGVLLLLGLGLALATSPRSLGLAAAHLTRPFLGGRAWQVALALALLVHFQPLVWRSARTARTAFALRALPLPWPRRALLFGQLLLRHWSQRTWRQTLALASRGLDDPAAWEARLSLRPREWLAGLLVLGSGAGLLLG